jgi:hypothetical protein
LFETSAAVYKFGKAVRYSWIFDTPANVVKFLLVYNLALLSSLDRNIHRYID